MLSTCTSDRLKSDKLETSKYLDAKGRPKKLKNVRCDILEKCNDFLKRVEIDSSCVGLKFDFSKLGTNEPLSGFFAATGVTSMLEAREYPGLDLVMQSWLLSTDCRKLCILSYDVGRGRCWVCKIVLQSLVSAIWSPAQDCVGP
jgi:hypothetical protein